MKKNLLFLLLRLGLGALFIYAAFTKVGDLRKFAEEIANYRVLPAALVPASAAMMPGVELVAGALLCLNWLVRPAAALLSALLAVFIVALSQALLRGINLECGCFGGPELATWGTVARDAVLLIAALAVAWVGPTRGLAARQSP